MTKPDQDNIDVEYLLKYLQELEVDFSTLNFDEFSPSQATILATLPHDVKKYIKQVENIIKEQKEGKVSSNPAIRFEQKQKQQKELQKIAKEVLVISIASKKSVDESLEFQNQLNIDPNSLNDFNKNNLNPLTAALLSQKSNEELQKLIRAGCDVNFKSQNGSNCAHFAVIFDVDFEKMQFLIDNGVDLNAKNDFGLTPLDMAALKGDEAMVKLLKENGAQFGSLDPKSKNKDDQERIRPKVKKESNKEEILKEEDLDEKRRQDDIAKIKQAMEETADYELEMKEKQKSDLDAIVKVEDFIEDEIKLSKDIFYEEQKLKTLEQEMIEKMLGVDLEKVSLNMILLQSIERGYSTIAAMLVSAGADVNSLEGGISAVEMAVKRGDDSLLKLVLSRANESTIRVAVRSDVGGRLNIKEQLEVEEKPSTKVESPESAKLVVKELSISML